MEADSLSRTGAAPYLLGTGSTGMLLITSKPMGDQVTRGNMDRIPHAHAHSNSSSADVISRSYGGGVSRDNDSGISNGHGSSFVSSRHHDLLDVSISSSRYGDSAGRNATFDVLDTSLSESRNSDYRNNLSLSRLNSSGTDFPGRSLSVSRLNTSQDWSSPVGKNSLSAGRARATMTSSTDYRGKSRVRNGEQDDAYHALEESEDRRQILVQRLKDAQETIKLQSQRLTDVEDSAKDSSLVLDDLRFKEKEYRKKIALLEREKTSYHTKHMEGIKSRESLQHRIEALTTELASLRTTSDLAQTDMTRKDVLLKQLTTTVADLEDENNKLIKCKETMTKEVSALKQSAELSKSRCEYLENHEKDISDEMSRLKEIVHELTQEKFKFGQKVAALDNQVYSLNEEKKSHSDSVQNLTQDKNQMMKKIASLEATIGDLKSTLVGTSADKERFFQQKMELTSLLQNANFDKENLNKVRCTLEEQLCELNAELAQVRLQIDKNSDTRRQQDEEMSAVKKVGEVLSTELASIKHKLDQSQEQVDSLEHTKKLAFQQHELYEQEIQSLETQLKQSKQMLTTLRDEYQKEKDASDQTNISIKEELKELKGQRNQAELSCHEAEAKLRQAEHNMKDLSDEMAREVDKWKDQCEKLTASNSRREMEIQTINKSLSDLKAEAGILRENNDKHHARDEDVADARSEVAKIKEENRRLLQERAENQQVIQLLEMQKQILAKSKEGSINKVHDVQHLQYQVEQLSIDKQHLEEKIEILEQREKEFLENNKENMKASESPADFPLSARERLCELETQNHHLRALNNRITEQLTQVEQENVSMQAKFRESVPKADFKSSERQKELLEESLEHLKSEYNRLEERYKQDLSSAKSHNNEKDLWVSQKENQGLEKQVSLLTTQKDHLEEQLQSADNKKSQLQKQLDAVQDKLFSVCQEDNTQVIQLQKQVNKLTSELETAKSAQRKQENTIQSLREKSLESAGEDLVSMKSELKKLGAVIQQKDTEIVHLESQLATTKASLSEREKEVNYLTENDVGKDGTDSRNDNSGRLQGLRLKNLEERVGDLEDENDELSERIAKIKKERDAATREADELRDSLDDLQKTCDTEHTARLDRMKKDLASRDRQIESLEEQLRRNTSIEIKKLKRGASKVDLLKAENRRLQSQLTPATSHLPRFTPPEEAPSSPLDDAPVNDTPASSFSSRLQERLHGQASSPSQRLLSRLYPTTDGNDDKTRESPTTAHDSTTNNNTSDGEEDDSDDDGEHIGNLSSTLQDELDNCTIKMDTTSSTNGLRSSYSTVMDRSSRDSREDAGTGSRSLRHSTDGTGSAWTLRKTSGTSGIGSRSSQDYKS